MIPQNMCFVDLDASVLRCMILFRASWLLADQIQAVPGSPEEVRVALQTLSA